jgi:hypothetical protein
MTALVRVCAVAGATLLAGCGSWAPSWDFMPSLSSGGPAVSLTIESDPPGADAKTSVGPSCRTPCMVPVAADREFTVSYALNGYLPQVIAVTPRMPEPTRFEPEIGSGAPAPDLSPNPVFAQLQPAPPPPPVSRKGRGKARPKQVARQPQVVPPQ